MKEEEQLSYKFSEEFVKALIKNLKSAEFPEDFIKEFSTNFIYNVEATAPNWKKLTHRIYV